MESASRAMRASTFARRAEKESRSFLIVEESCTLRVRSLVRSDSRREICCIRCTVDDELVSSLLSSCVASSVSASESDSGSSLRRVRGGMSGSDSSSDSLFAFIYSEVGGGGSCSEDGGSGGSSGSWMCDWVDA